MEFKRFADKTIELSLFSIVVLVPIIFFTRTNDVFELNKMFVFKFFILLAAAMFLITSLKQNKIELIRTDLDFPILGYFAACIITTLVTRNMYLSVFGVYEDFEGIITMAYYTVFYYILVNSVRTSASINKIITLIMFTTLTITGYGLAQNFGWDFVMWNPETYSPDRFFSTLGNPNFLAAYLVETAPILFILFFITRKESSTTLRLTSIFTAIILPFVLFTFALTGHIGPGGVFIGFAAEAALILLGIILGKKTLPYGDKLLVLMVLVMTVVVVFLTKSRAGFLSLLVTIGLIIVYTVIDASKEENQLFSKNKPWFIVLGLMLVASMFIPKVQEAFVMLWDRSKSLFSMNGITMTPRVYIWKSALMMYRDYPVLGTGLDTFQVMFPYYRFPIYWQLEWNGTPEKTHNIFLQVLATQGIVGMSMYLLMFTAFFKKSFNLIFGERNITRRYLVFGVFMGALGYIIQGLFNYTVLAYGMMFYLAIGLVIAMDSVPKKTYSAAVPALLGRNFGLTAGVIIASMLTLQVLTARVWVADMFYKVGNIGAASDRDDLAVSYYAKAVEFNPNSEIYWVKYGIAYEKMMRKEQDPQRRLNYINAALNIHSRTLRMNPMNGYNYNNLARVYRFYGESGMDTSKYEDAILNYNKAIERDPNNAYFGLDLATVYINRKELQKAAELCSRYAELYPSFAVPNSYLGYIYMLMGREYANRAVYYYERAIDNKQWFRDRTTELSTYSNLAILYVNLNRFEQAAGMFEKVVAVKPDYKEGWLNLGRLKMMMKKYAEATAAFEKAYNIDPSDPGTRAALDEAGKKAGK
ncbi:MAG: O-antigen ligase family protein [Spirochaetia bacterium]|nr:O-antigen ligase family protein [Spirochaetia bacterium]